MIDGLELVSNGRLSEVTFELMLIRSTEVTFLLTVPNYLMGHTLALLWIFDAPNQMWDSLSKEIQIYKTICTLFPYFFHSIALVNNFVFWFLICWMQRSAGQRTHPSTIHGYQRTALTTPHLRKGINKLLLILSVIFISINSMEGQRSRQWTFRDLVR